MLTAVDGASSPSGGNPAASRGTWKDMPTRASSLSPPVVSSIEKSSAISSLPWESRHGFQDSSYAGKVSDIAAHVSPLKQCMPGNARIKLAGQAHKGCGIPERCLCSVHGGVEG